MDKAKYHLCKSILRYEHDNKLTSNIAKQLGLTVVRVEYILYSHIDKFTLDELVIYTNSLHIPCQIKINIPYGSEKVATEAH